MPALASLYESAKKRPVYSSEWVSETEQHALC